MLELGRYTLVRQIGRGGMAEIWKAKASGPSGFVKFLAVKMILPEIADDRLFVAMFVDEAKLAASLVHPNLVSVFDFGEIEQRLFLAMEYIAGANLHRLVNRLQKVGEMVPVDVALYVALEACRGLGHAHARTGSDGQPLGIVHRDVSPQNILISVAGDVKVSDFGIAKAASAISRTAAGQVRGKLAYMSPEQLDNSPLDGRADLFALGIVLYEMLTGARLFQGRSSEEVSERIRQFDPTASLDFARVPEHARPTLARLLQPARDQRQRDAAELEAELGAHLGLPGLARARQELAALVARLFPDELAADARDERDPRYSDPAASDTMATAVTVGGDGAAAGGGAGDATKVEVPTGSRPRRSPTPPRAQLMETPAPVGELAAVRPPPRSRLWPVGAAAALLVAGGAASAWHFTHHATASGPHRGGTLRLASAFDAENLDMFSAEQSRTRMAMNEVLEPLLAPDRDGDIQPFVLDRAELSADGHRVTLHVREGVTFHDHPCLPGGHGRQAAGDDVAYSILQAVAAAQIALPIREVVVTGPREVAVELREPAPFYENELSNVRLVPHELEGCEDLRRMKQPVGTGPFRFAAPPHGARLELVRAPDYWDHAEDGSQLPFLDGLDIVPLDDGRSAISRMTHGDIDIAMPHDDDWPALVDLSAERPVLTPHYQNLGLDVAMGSSRSRVAIVVLLAGPHDGPFRDVAVRRALARVIDRAGVVAAAPAGRPMSGPAGRVLDARMVGYDAKLAPLEVDLDAARKLLADAGHPGGIGIPPITIGTVRYQTISDRIVQNAAAIGLVVRTATITPATGFDALVKGEIDALLTMDNWSLVQGENANLVDECDRFGLSAALGKLHVQLAATRERADRAPIYRQMEVALLDDLPVIPLAWGDIHRPLELFIARHDVRDFDDAVTATANIGDLRRTWLDR